MKPLILALAVMLFTFPALAQQYELHAATALTPVKAEYVCMVNNTAFDKPQISTEVDGKTYYGCCSMCKEKLEKSAEVRTAVDPISGQSVDKASAVIGALPDGKVHYFESEENMQAFGHDASTHKTPSIDHDIKNAP